MKNLYLLVCLLVAVFAAQTIHAQTTYQFTYDASGNRLTRAVIVLKSATLSPDSLQAKQERNPLDDQIGLQKARIYPNPTQGMLRIDLPGLTDQQAWILVYDPSGKQVVKKTALSSGNEVDLSAHPSGSYIMVIHIGQEKKEWKIIKE